MRNWYLGNYKKGGREKNLYPFKQEARKTKCWVQVDPLMHLSVNVKTKERKKKQHFFGREAFYGRSDEDNQTYFFFFCLMYPVKDSAERVFWKYSFLIFRDPK